LLLQPKILLQQPNVLLIELNILLLKRNIFVIPILTNDLVGITKPFFSVQNRGFSSGPNNQVNRGNITRIMASARASLHAFHFIPLLSRPANLPLNKSKTDNFSFFFNSKKFA